MQEAAGDEDCRIVAPGELAIGPDAETSQSGGPEKSKGENKSNGISRGLAPYPKSAFDQTADVSSG